MKFEFKAGHGGIFIGTGQESDKVNIVRKALDEGVISEKDTQIIEARLIKFPSKNGTNAD